MVPRKKFIQLAVRKLRLIEKRQAFQGTLDHLERRSNRARSLNVDLLRYCGSAIHIGAVVLLDCKSRRVELPTVTFRVASRRNESNVFPERCMDGPPFAIN